MKKILVLSFLVLSFVSANAQEHHIQVGGGPCFSGSGDAIGIFSSVEYSKKIAKKYSWSVAIANTIHDYDDSWRINNSIYPAGSRGVRVTIAGLQVGSHLGYNFLNSNKHELLGRIGAVLRYQSSSSWSQFETIDPNKTKLEYPVAVLFYSAPARTIAIGPSAQLVYSYTMLQKYSISIMTGLQIDTNGDNLSYTSLSFGRRF